MASSSCCSHSLTNWLDCYTLLIWETQLVPLPVVSEFLSWTPSDGCWEVCPHLALFAADFPMLVATLIFGSCDSFFFGVGLHIQATWGGETITEASNVLLMLLIWCSYQASLSNIWLSSQPWHSDAISRDFVDSMVWDEEGGMGCNTDLLLMVMALSSEGSGVEQLGGGGW